MDIKKIHSLAIEIWEELVFDVKYVWHKLPPRVQTALAFGCTAALTTLSTMLFDCSSWHCVRRALGASITAGLLAVKFLWTRPGSGPKVPIAPPVSN